MSSFSQRLAPRVAVVTIILLIALFGLVRLKATAESGSGKEAVIAGRAQAHSESIRAYAPKAYNSFSPLAVLNVDRFDDPSPAASFSACTVAPNDCSLRGAIIAANLAPGSTINLPAGTYTLSIAGTGENNAATGDLDVRGNNTSIIGAGAGVSIIQQTVADRVFDVNPTLVAGFNFILSGVTVQGGNLASGSGAGLLMGSPTSTVTLTNCSFTGNSARNNGGAISFSVNSVSNLTATDCSFSNNTAVTGVGGAINYSAAGTLLIARTSFSGNAASANSGGAINATSIAGVGIYNISQTSFVNNSAGGTGRGGAIAKTNGLLNVSYSRLVGNTAAVPANGRSISILPGGSGSATVDDNWWGLNSGPGGSDLVGTMANTWLQLQASASPNSVCANGTSTINADIKKRNTGLDLTVELNGLPPFPASFVNTTPSLGAVSNASANFVDGAASATFNAGATNGTANVDVIADNQTRSASIQIQSNTTSDPPDVTACEGGTATFTTNAAGPGPITFVWKKGATVLNNGDLGGRVTIVSGASSSTLTISNVQSSDAATYTVEATGACSTASQSATLTVNTPTTTSDPPDQTVCAGPMANFSTTAGGTGPFTYAWTLDGSPYNGNSASISIDTTGMSGNHTVSVTTTGACGSASQSATLTVNSQATTTDPPDQTVCQGAMASFSTTAGGTGPFTYAWTLDGNAYNGNSASISINTSSLSGNHTVSVTTTGACGGATQSATLTVNTPTTTTDPPDQTVCAGAMANFSTTAGGTGPFTYAWTLDGSPYNGNSASISIDTTGMSGNHTVSVTTTGACGSASQSATLTVQATTTTTDPADQTVCAGATANFSTTAGGTGPFSYAWTVDGSPSGGNSSTLNVNTTGLSAGNHSLSVTTTGTCGSASQSATLTVQAVTTTTDPADQTVCQGATASFSTTAGGTGPFHYAWTVDGSASGGDSASLNVNTTGLSAGNHTVSVTTTGTCGSASQSATLTVQATTTTTDPADQSVCEGATANFSTTAGGTGPFHYAWTLDGNPYNGDSASISVNTTGFSQGAHTVAVTTTGSCGSASQSATLNVNNGAPTITVANSVISMWPPNHQYQNFTLSDFGVTANSACDGNLTNSVVIMSVTSDELEDNPGGGDGNTVNDIVIAANCKSVQLRRERDGNLDGRVYTITFVVKDSIGHTATGTAQVRVPLNQSGGTVVNSGPHYTVNGTCP